MNKSTKIILPLLLGAAIAIGILIGTKIQGNINRANIESVGLFQPDKLSIITRLIEKDYVDTINKNELIENVIPVILDELDPHSSYIPASEMQDVTEEMRGNFSGIGVQFVMQSDTVVVVDVISGGPSNKLGILAGDRIIQVNKSTVSGIGLKSDSIVSLLRGKKGTTVDVSIERNGFDKLIDYTIERGEIPLFSVDVSYVVKENIGLVKVNRFAETTHKEFVAAISDLSSKGISKLIVDLRGNSGGYLQAVFNMVDEFLPANKMIVYTEGKSRPRYEYRSTDKGIWKDGDVAVLIDEFSASASEIFAGAIQDNDRGLIIGRRSFGKGLVQEQIPFMDGSALRLTVARFYTPSGRSIQKSYKEGNEAYRMDLFNRMRNEEMVNQDSIHLPDSLKYYTSAGRLVFGGGGIMPDFFVPADTLAFNNFYSEIIAKNLLYPFAFKFADQQRSTLNKMDEATQIESYLIEQKVFNQFISHIRKAGIKYSAKEYDESSKLLEKQLYALIARNIIGDKGYYPILFEIDNTVLKAIQLLEKNWSYKEVAQINKK
ncbi:MAG TPA: S41 family peptidase [Prolixibacteraceae bacterium]|nr:S41 family peptidase [Bacteroidales bacterium]HQN92506.1 S41 family peptidase [Prolixibacteraceae bacterium]HUM87949.1 S41 family peptidase [Prolixibacteraceae bacterium]